MPPLDLLKSDAARRLRAAARALTGNDVFYRVDDRRDVVLYGSAAGQGGWMLDPSRLGPDSVVYAFGIGRDLSFDLAVVERHGCTVHAFDPTPDSLAWVQEQQLPAQLNIHELALGGRDGRFDMAPPERPEWVSMSAVRNVAPSDAVSVPVARLSTVMGDLGHDRIDLLKMDIEGSEYDVIDEILAHDLRVDQILVEFHHRFEEIGAGMTRAAVDGLRAAGYRLVFVSPTMEDYTFIHPAATP